MKRSIGREAEGVMMTLAEVPVELLVVAGTGLVMSAAVGVVVWMMYRAGRKN